jgi:hypothetical protein
MYGEVLKATEARLGPAHADTITARDKLLFIYESAGRWADAEPLRRDALARRRKAAPPDSPALATDLAMLGLDLMGQAKWPEAEPILRECLAMREKVAAESWQRFNTMSQLGGALAGQGRFAEAEPLVVRGYEGMAARRATISPAGKPRLSEAELRLVRMYEAWGKPEDATRWKARLGLLDLPEDVFARP